MNDAERSFIADVESIGGDYEREFDRRSKEYDEEGAALRARLKQLESERWGMARGLNEKYIARVAKAAQIRISQADGQEVGGIEAAARDMGALIGGACHDSRSFNASVARARIESEERKREERDAFFEVEERGSAVTRTAFV